MQLNELNNKLIKQAQSKLDRIPEGKWKGQVHRAVEEFQKSGIPTKKMENWKYTNPTSYFEDCSETFHQETQSKGSEYDFLSKFKEIIVLKNGSLSSSLKNESLKVSSKPSHEFNSEGISVDELKDHSLALYNLSQVENIVEIEILKDIDSPIIVVFETDESAHNKSIHTLLNVVSKEETKATLVEVHLGSESSKSISNHLTNIHLEAKSNLEHIRIYKESSQSLRTTMTIANIKKDAFLDNFTLALTGGMIRNDILFNLNEENATCEANGLFALKNEQHCDFSGVINHLAPNTFSDQLIKGLLDDKSHGIYSGKVIIHRDAQKCEANQLNKNLLLAKKAHIDTRPQLEVYADDVKCAHGATTGQIGKEEIFYLQSRGISADRAMSLLKEAFAQDAIDKIKNQDIRNVFSELLFKEYSNLLK